MRFRQAAHGVMVLLLGGCSGRIDGVPEGGSGAAPVGGSGGSTTRGGDATAGTVATPSEPLAPNELDTSCTMDAPHPRRLMRLAPGELVTSLRTGLAIDDAMIPASFAASPSSQANETLVVSRDFLEDLDHLASATATKLSGAPGALLACDVGKFGSDSACTTDFLKKLTARLYRGRASADDLTALSDLGRSVAARSGGKRALEIVARAAMMSPKSLYLSEGLDRADASKAPLSGPELAAFLSYRITGGPPSDALLAAATAAQPPTADGVRKLLDQQLGPELLRKATAAFLRTWLDTGDVATLKRDLTKHPNADASFMQRLADETDAALTSLASTDGLDLTRLLTADARSALLEDDRSGLASSIGRPGVFALPGVLASISSADHTNIPRRGRLMLRSLFCQEAPKPPPNALSMQPAVREGASERERFEAVEKQATCSGCHTPINHLAYAFEAYDELGAMRTKDDRGNAINAAATFTPSSGNAITYKDARDLMTQVAGAQQVGNCVAIHGFRQATRRPERGAADACMVRDLAQAARGSGYRIADLVRDAIARAAAADRAD